MDSGNSGTDAVRDVARVSTLADKDCDQCYGRGITRVVRSSLIGGAALLEGRDELCQCVVRFLDKNPALAFEFLKLHNQVQ